jgi:hypothetical protein
MSLTEPEFRQALMQVGSLLPMNAEAVEALDRTDPVHIPPLPPSLSCVRILEQIRAPRPANLLKFSLPVTLPSAAEGLARAARNGEELPDEIIAQMQADREKIEGQK